MTIWKKTLLSITATVRDAIETIDSSGLLVALVVDEKDKLLGIVTDGDVRRAMLNGTSLDCSVEKIMNTKPYKIGPQDSPDNILKLFQKTHLRHLPVVDGQGHLIGLQLVDELTNKVKHDNWVVLMAGGLGQRLGKLTENCPKPLLKVGNKPLLETIIESFMDHGFHRFYISVNYKAEMIEEYFGDGERMGIEIRYIREKERLGTAGALGLLPDDIEEPLIVMNGDVLTKVSFQMLLDFHHEHEVKGTICVREYDFQVPYGVVNLDEFQVTEINEKPTHRFFVNAGIYVLSPDMLKMIPQNTYFDMPTLFDKMLENDIKTVAFPIREYWLDIGQVKDFQRANGDFQEVFR